ncbi:MAG: NADH:ubiquinone reductase (Na(+)-transporting) subunit C [Candidatus Cyclobacteriaceae bacterium M2_1C_046]
MRQSNTYVIGFTVVLTIVIGGLLSWVSQALAPAQKLSIELDTKSSILSSVVDIKSLELTEQELLAMYDERIESLVVDINGNEVTQNEKGEPIVAENVDIQKNYKKDPENRLYPVYKYMNPETGDVEAYILPLYGAGLWDKIWGYIALEDDLNTIIGASYDHKAETPGLGARISNSEVQQRYVGKEIFSETGELVSVRMLKGEGNANLGPHEIDGLSGATVTAQGVNNMLKNYLTYYEAYFNKLKAGA